MRVKMSKSTRQTILTAPETMGTKSFSNWQLFSSLSSGMGISAVGRRLAQGFGRKTQFVKKIEITLHLTQMVLTEEISLIGRETPFYAGWPALHRPDTVTAPSSTSSSSTPLLPLYYFYCPIVFNFASLSIVTLFLISSFLIFSLVMRWRF